MGGPSDISSLLDEAGPLLCPSCGYDLRGAESERCPECGEEVDWETLRESNVPWARRKWIGRINAYVRTVWMVSVGSRALRHERVKPQDEVAAARFGRVTAALVALTCVGWMVAGIQVAGGLESVVVRPEQTWRPPEIPGWAIDWVVPWSAGATIYGLLPACAGVLGVFLARAHRSLFRSKDATEVRGRDAMALADYAGGPMALMSLPSLLWGIVAAGYWLAGYELPHEMTSVDWIVNGVGACVGATMLLTLVRGTQWAVRAREADFVFGLAAGIRLVGTWVLGVIGALAFLPWVVGFFWIVAHSSMQ